MLVINGELGAVRDHGAVHCRVDAHDVLARCQTDGHEHLIRAGVTRLEYEDLGKGVTAMRVSRGAMQTNVDRRHLTLAAPCHLLPRAAVPDGLPDCHPRDHWRASSTLDGELAAVGYHRAVHRGVDAHYVLARRQSTGHEQLIRAGVARLAHEHFGQARPH
eukprot:scaffold80681_cov66-Phaeocystis_antarctica.AAC.4